VRADVGEIGYVGAMYTDGTTSLCPQSHRCCLRQCTSKALCQGFCRHLF